MYFTTYILCSLLSVCVGSSQYDQRQTGDFNVQVDLKDIQIFAVLKGDKEEYVDYDYAYDYSELTIKPQNRTTPRPFNGTSASTEQNDTRENSTIATTVPQDHTIAPIKNEFTTTEFTITNSIPDNDSTTIKKLETTTQQIQIKNVTTAPKRSSNRKICRKGYVLNEKGHCQLKLNSNGNALLKLVRLSQKLKSRRENKSNDDA